jgi:hypothetical protein
VISFSGSDFQFDRRLESGERDVDENSTEMNDAGLRLETGNAIQSFDKGGVT